jgi:hypothetical protein
MKVYNRTILKFKDYQNKESESPLINFRRVFLQYEYFYEDGKLFLMTNKKKNRIFNSKKQR